MAAQHSHSSPRYIYNILTEHTFLGSYYLKSEFVVRTGGIFLWLVIILLNVFMAFRPFLVSDVC